MNGSMKCGPGWHAGSGMGQNHAGIPLIPAPIAFCTLMFGLMMGFMIGRRKTAMHGMEMGGGHGGDWMMRMKMMRMMGPHHHHGDGMPACACGESSDVASEGQEHAPAE